MAKPKPLPPTKLRAFQDPDKLPFSSSAAAPKGGAEPPQPRALHALDMALKMDGPEYNVFVSGPPEMGRTRFTKAFLAPRAARLPTPPDLLYVYNFQDPARPKAMSLPAGRGRELRRALARAVDELREDIPARLELEPNVKRRESMRKEFQDKRETAIREMAAIAEDQGFKLEMDPDGSFSIYPLLEGKIAGEAEMDRLDPAVREALKTRGDELFSAIGVILRDFGREERDFREAEKRFERDVVAACLDEALAPVRQLFRKAPQALSHLDALSDDVLDNHDMFLEPRERRRSTDSSDSRASAESSGRDACGPGGCGSSCEGRDCQGGGQAALPEGRGKLDGRKRRLVEPETPEQTDDGKTPGDDRQLPAGERSRPDRPDRPDRSDRGAGRQPRREGPESGHEGCDEGFFTRYDVNLVVDNAETKGAPVVVCEHPTFFNLLGCMERESEMGALFTDFGLIKAGDLHRAQGGFLVIRASDLLPERSAWEGLMRALRGGRIKIEDPTDAEGQLRTRTIEPEPVALTARIALVGDDEVYEALLWGDERFRKFFKLKAHLGERVDRNAANVGLFVRAAAAIARDDKLPVFEASALAYLVDNASRLASDQTKLSLRLPLTRELMLEAAALARAGKKKTVTADILREASRLREFRQNLYQAEFLEDYDREIIKVATDGAEVGRANGLSVSWHGERAFGLPHQIACNVGVGHGGVVDLEREAEMGGPIHTKGMMIIKSYLLGLFGQDKPLVFSGSLCFEQNYAGIEGDSASGAELAALLSALSGIALDLSKAFTGAVSQSGAIMAVGGVNEKIEGFFAVCSRRGLTGRQGVILPADNVKDLMLADEIVEACAAGRFHVWAVTRIEEAMELLTGQPAGKRKTDGSYPTGSLFRAVDDRIRQLGEIARRYETANRTRT